MSIQYSKYIIETCQLPSGSDSERYNLRKRYTVTFDPTRHSSLVSQPPGEATRFKGGIQIEEKKRRWRRAIRFQP